MGGGQPLLGYGLTETNAVGCGNLNENYLAKPTSTGPASKPLVDLAILDNAGQPVPQGKIGEVSIRSIANFEGYWNRPDATAEAFTEDGWFRTGDLGAMAEDGWIVIKGRLKNMIVGPSGENIYPEDIEEVLNSNRFVAESVVTEEDGKLIALVYFDTTALEEAYDEFKFKMSVGKEQLSLKMEEIKKDIEADPEK